MWLTKIRLRLYSSGLVCLFFGCFDSLGAGLRKTYWSDTCVCAIFCLPVARVILRWYLSVHFRFPKVLPCTWMQLESNESCVKQCKNFNRLQRTERRCLWWWFQNVCCHFWGRNWKYRSILLVECLFISGILGCLQKSLCPRHGINFAHYQIVGCDWTGKFSSGGNHFPMEEIQTDGRANEMSSRICLGPMLGFRDM